MVTTNKNPVTDIQKRREKQPSISLKKAIKPQGRVLEKKGIEKRYKNNLKISNKEASRGKMVEK